MKACKDGNPTQIFIAEGSLTFEGDSLASKDEYQSADRCVGSVFEALRPEEHIQLKDGYFVLDSDLDLIQDWSIV